MNSSSLIYSLSQKIKNVSETQQKIYLTYKWRNESYCFSFSFFLKWTYHYFENFCFILFWWLLALKTMQANESVDCVYIVMASSIPLCSYRWEFFDHQQRISIARHPKENSICESIRKSLPFAVSMWKPHFSPLLFWLASSTSRSYKLITEILSLTLSSMISKMNKCLSWVSYSTAPKATDLPCARAMLDTVLDTGRVASYLVTCLSPGFYKGF